MSATPAYTIPTIPHALYQEHGETVVNMARHIATDLYCARSRLEMTEAALANGELSQAAKHAQRRREHVAAVLASIKRYGRHGEQAYELAKKMEGPGAQLPV